MFVATWHETATVYGADRWVEQVRQTPFGVRGTSGGDAGGGPAMRMYVSLIWDQRRVHDVSILMTMAAGDGLCLGAWPRAKTSMTIMRPRQQGHGRGSTRG